MDISHQQARTEVVIVGAGPTGLSLATQLLRYGIDFILLEKNEGTTPLSKAIVVQARTLEIFQELGIAAAAVGEGQVTKGLNMYYKGRQRAYIPLGRLGEGLSPFPFALSLEQCKTETLLVDYLAARGRSVHWQSAFSRFEQTEKGVTVYYTDPLGQEKTISAAYLVGCDGAGSPVRHQLGLTFAGDTVPKIFYVADVKLKSTVINKNELFIFLIPKGFVIFFPMEGEGHYRMIGILPGAHEEDDTIPFETVRNSVQQQIQVPIDFEEVRWFSSYKVHSRKAASFIKGDCFLAGDAAHIHTPAGGQGMNTGIQDAYNLAWKLAYTIRGAARPEVLASYNAERMSNAKRLLRTTDQMFDIIAGTSGLRNFIRLHVIPLLAGSITRIGVLRKRLFPLLSQIGISYPESYLTVTSTTGRVKAGDRMPYFTFRDGSQIFDYLGEPSFKLLFFGKQQAATLEDFDDGPVKIRVQQFSEIPPSLFGKANHFYILLRPDNHISYIGTSLAKCRDVIHKIMLPVPEEPPNG